MISVPNGKHAFRTYPSVNMRSPLLVDRVRTPGQDDADNLVLPQNLVMNRLTVDERGERTSPLIYSNAVGEGDARVCTGVVGNGYCCYRRGILHRSYM